VVVDASALLAVLFGEPHAQWLADQMSQHAGELRMSTVNLAEALIRLRDRQPQLYDVLEGEVLESGIRFVPPDLEQARLGAAARLQFPLNLGDCFAYALARAEGCPILTADRDFKRFENAVLPPPV
jgi:ribonuclease VapC